MRILEGHDEAVAKFVGDWECPERPAWQPGYRAFGILRSDGALVGGVVFDGWQPTAKRVELSARAIDPRAFSTTVIRQLGQYPFRQLDCFRMWARTSIDNKRCRKLLRGIGFTEESTQAHWYGQNRHSVTLRVTKPEWERRWGYDLKLAA